MTTPEALGVLWAYLEQVNTRIESATSDAELRAILTELNALAAQIRRRLIREAARGNADVAALLQHPDLLGTRPR